MEFKFEQEISKKKVTFEISIAPLTKEDARRATLIRGYKCDRVCVDNVCLKNPEFVVCYAKTNKKKGPALYFKFGAARWMIDKYDALNTGGQGLYLPIPEEVKVDYLKGMEALDQRLESLKEEAEALRVQNDLKVKDEDLIEISYSPQFVKVKYPLDSNRATEESKIWSQFDGNLDLDDWIEINLEPYCVGLGCGSSKKYLISFGKYKELLTTYKAHLNV